MSLGGGRSTALNKAVAAVVALGIPIIVAAGNEASVTPFNEQFYRWTVVHCIMCLCIFLAAC